MVTYLQEKMHVSQTLLEAFRHTSPAATPASISLTKPWLTSSPSALSLFSYSCMAKNPAAPATHSAEFQRLARPEKLALVARKSFTSYSLVRELGLVPLFASIFVEALICVLALCAAGHWSNTCSSCVYAQHRKRRSSTFITMTPHPFSQPVTYKNLSACRRRSKGGCLCELCWVCVNVAQSSLRQKTDHRDQGRHFLNNFPMPAVRPYISAPVSALASPALAAAHMAQSAYEAQLNPD